MRTRVLSIACYLGFAPEIELFASKSKDNPILQHHTQQALGLFTFLLFSFVFYVIILTMEVIVGFRLELYFPHIVLNPIIENMVFVADFILAIPFIVWGVLWMIGITRANRGSTLPIFLIARLAANKTSRVISLVWMFVLQFLLIAAVFILLRGNQLAHRDQGPASVYMLYETMDNVPRWVFAAGFYPISEVATARWGDGSVVVAPLTRENINEAIRNGRLVFLASHGGYKPGTVALSYDENYAPDDIQQGSSAGPNLQFFYIAGCDVGAMETEWKQFLAPAKVITFNRLSWEGEHIFWLWLNGPIIVSELK